jgi:hypothetical protein
MIPPRTLTRRERLLRLAVARQDRLARATLEADRPDWRPEPDAYPMFVGLRTAA